MPKQSKKKPSAKPSKHQSNPAPVPPLMEASRSRLSTDGWKNAYLALACGYVRLLEAGKSASPATDPESEKLAVAGFTALHERQVLFY